MLRLFVNLRLATEQTIKSQQTGGGKREEVDFFLRKSFTVFLGERIS